MKKVFLLIATVMLFCQCRPVTVPADDAHIQYFGRVSLTTQGARFTFPGVQVRFGFTGTSLAMLAKPSSGFFMVSVDGCEAYKVGLDSETDSILTLAEGLSKGEHQLALMYITEGYIRLPEIRGFVLDPCCHIMDAEALPTHRVEFIGNSITCGYGVEADNEYEHFKDSTSNHYYTYAAETARRLDAIAMVVARSGIGVYRNFDGPRTGDSINMNTEYKHTLLYNAEEDWDFSRFTPEVVCINLGTNDTSTDGAEPDLLRAGYARLLAQVRAAYPQAKIIFLCGSMMNGDALALASAMMNDVVREANENGDTEVYRFDFTPQTGSLGYGADWHPSRAQHQLMADELTPFIQSLMNW